MIKIDYLKLTNIYYNEIRHSVRNEKKLLAFNSKKEEYFYNIIDSFENSTYRMAKYNIFLIYEPKIRVIMSLNLYDKLVNHYITREILMPKLEYLLSSRNVATRKNMGLKKALELFKKDIEKCKKYENVYVLKLDIKKFFYNIDHGILKELIKPHLSFDEYNVISQIIDSTNYSYINETINKLQKNVTDVLPIYKRDKGLPIGNLSSQFLAIFYLYKLHHFIIHDLHIKHLVVYMDDYILIHHDKEYLKKCLKIIEKKLNNEYKLELNKKKTRLVNLNEGIEFLGYKFKLRDKKLFISITNAKKHDIRKKIIKRKKEFIEHKISYKKVFSSINTYKNSYNFAKTYYIQNTLKKNWYN